MSKPVSPRRKSPEKKNANLQATLQAAKRTFLTSTETKSPLKRPLSPELDGKAESPARATVGIVTPSPHKKVKASWKTRWQAGLGGVAPSKGRRGARSEADKLLGDEGVIQMLNRVPSVHGVMPKNASASSRVQRGRGAPAPVKPNVKPEKRKYTKKVEEMKEKDIKLEPVEAPESNGVEPARVNGMVNGLVSPRRAARSLPRDSSSELQHTLQAVRGDDCFAHLTELPAEQMDLLMNCDIRYSLPRQGVPRHLPPVGPEPAKPVSAARPSPPVVRASPDSSSSALVKVRPVTVSVESKSHGVKALFPPPGPAPRCTSELLASYRERGGAAAAAPPSLAPGQYSSIFVRLFDTFAQVTLASPRSRLKGSLSTAAMEELVHVLSYVAAAPRLRGLLLIGVGGVFCQGIDLTELCQDRPDRRRETAALLAAALEKLVTALASFPKLLVAAVNGAAVGLGVTMLPLFDIVYANDKAEFSTFYSRLGQVPEACASVLLPLASPTREMLLLGRTLSAQELVTIGLVTQAFFPGRLMEEVIPRMRKATSDALSPGLQWNKMLLKQNQKNQVESVIAGETELLKEMWSSKEFHVNLVNFVNSEKCLQFQNPTS